MSVSHDCISGRGFASRFLARADSITGTGMNKPFNVNTERRTVVFYKE